MFRSRQASKRSFFLNQQNPFQATEKYVLDLSNIGYENSVVIGSTVQDLVVSLENAETAGDEAFGCGYDVEGVAGDGEGVG